MAIRNSSDTTKKVKIQWLVFTDLDGTLLNHHDYKFDAAIPTLQALKKADIPTIANTSKTCAEMILLRKQLDNHHPFITENGAAVYIPENYFTARPNDVVDIAIDGERFWVHINGKSRDHWINTLSTIEQVYHDSFKSFTTMGNEGVQQATGLTATNAALANTREASEPILWTGSPEGKQPFIQALSQADAQVLEGGRFLHILDKRSSKGSAMQWLQSLYQVDTAVPIKTIAVGDSDNDLSMLEAADIAVIIRKPDGSQLKFKPGYLSAVNNDVARVRVSKLTGAAGWAETLHPLIALCLNQDQHNT